MLPGDGFKVALMDFGAKKNIEKSLNKQWLRSYSISCIYKGRRDYRSKSRWNHAYRTVLEIQRNVWRLSRRLRSYLLQQYSNFCVSVLDISSWHLPHGADTKKMKYGHQWSQPSGKRFKNRQRFIFHHRTMDMW